MIPHPLKDTEASVFLEEKMKMLNITYKIQSSEHQLAGGSYFMSSSFLLSVLYAHCIYFSSSKHLSYLVGL